MGKQRKHVNHGVVNKAYQDYPPDYDLPVDYDTGGNPKGEPYKYDPTFKGPIKNRSCTDIICLLLFLVCFLGFLAVGAWSFSQGDPRLLLYPTDSDGNLCGYGDYADKPYLFFFDLIDCYKVGPAIISQGCPTPQVCVSACPNHTFSAFIDLSLGRSDAEIKTDLICVNGTDMNSKTVKQLVEDEDCAAYYMESTQVAGRCIPSFISKLVDKATGVITQNGTDIVNKYGSAVNGTELEGSTKYLAILLNAYEYGSKIFQDLRASWWMILVGIGIGAIIAFIWIILMRCIAGPIVWLTIFLFLGVFSFTTYYTFTKYVDIRDSGNSTGTFTFTTNLSYYTSLKETWLALGILSAIVLGIIVILLLFLRERICIAIELIKEASRAVGMMIFSLFWPIIPYVLQIVFVAFWAGSALFLASSGKATFAATNVTNETVDARIFNATGNNQWDQVQEVQSVVQAAVNSIPCDPNANGTAGSICSFLKYGNNDYMIYLQVYQLFMWLWIMNFIIALGQVTLAGAFASYYWAFNKDDDIPSFPVTVSLGRSLRYHIGSMAFGAFIIAVIQLIRIFLEYLDHKVKGSENCCAKFIIKCCKCCFWCLEKFMKFLNKNAYIMVAVYGKNFCTSAKNAFFLIMRNIVRVAVVDNVTGFLMFIGKIMVTGAIGGIAFLWFSGDIVKYIPIATITDYITNYTPVLNYYLCPVIVICIGTFVVASAFFNVYAMAVDTLFLCFLEDLERNDGSAEKPYYMSKGLMEILGKNNKIPGGKGEKKSGCCGCC